jgi:hypothetical protein
MEMSLTLNECYRNFKMRFPAPPPPEMQYVKVKVFPVW